MKPAGACESYEIAEGVVTFGSSGAKGVVLFAKGGDHISKRLQGAHDLVGKRCNGKQQKQRGDGEDAEDSSR